MHSLMSIINTPFSRLMPKGIQLLAVMDDSSSRAAILFSRQHHAGFCTFGGDWGTVALRLLRAALAKSAGSGTRAKARSPIFSLWRGGQAGQRDHLWLWLLGAERPRQSWWRLGRCRRLKSPMRPE